MNHIIDLTGQQFERFTVLRQNGMRKTGTLWEVLCVCGTVKTVTGINLRRGKSKSCGCFRVDAKKTHGLHKHPLYQVHQAMRQRCYNPNALVFRNYGKRGIGICERWLDFQNFYADMIDTYQPGLTIERVDNALGYSPDNCIWADRMTQAQNMRTVIKVKGLSLSQYALSRGIPKSTARYKHKRGLLA